MNRLDAAQLIGIKEFPPGWKFFEVRRDGKQAGFFCTKGSEIHAWRSPEYSGRWLTRHDIEAIARPILDAYGCVKTSVRSSNLEGQRFVIRLGFARTHEANGLIYYETARLTHARY